MARASAWTSVRRAVAAAAFMLAAAPAAGQSPPNPYHPPLTTAIPPLNVLEAQFERIAFSSEFGGSNRRGRIIKWAGPIRARITGWRGEASRADIRDVLAQLSALSGLKIELLGPTAEGAANLTIQFRKTRVPGQALCNTFIDAYPRFTITKARVVITSINDYQRRHCIIEELTQSLGLVNDSPHVFPSAFNDSSRQQDLHPADEIMVQTLYDPRLYAGITVREARPIFRKILAELVARTPVTTDFPPPPAPAPGAAPAAPPKPRPEHPKAPAGQLEFDPSAFDG